MKGFFYILFFAAITCYFSCISSIELIESELSTSGKLAGQQLWTLNHDPAKGKPFFHPLSSTNGTIFTDLPKTDHPWHRGLWFSWKKINGVNYWEEKGYTGIPIGGHTRLLSNNRTTLKNQSIEFVQHLEYAPSIDATAIMRETRKILISAPNKDGNYTIDWQGEFTALTHDLVLDRTPLLGQENGKSFGGYAGLSVRMNKDMLKGSFLNSEGMELDITEASIKENKYKLHGQQAYWMLYQKDGGGSLLFMDAPTNLNYPSKWYISPDMPYFSPAVLYEKPYILKARTSLKLSYRILVSPKNIGLDLANDAWLKWTTK